LKAFIPYWERKKANGMPRYVLITSLWIVIGWGGALTLMSVVKQLQAGLPISIDFSDASWVEGLIIMIGIPVLISFLAWSINEWKYKKAITSQHQEEEPTESE